MPTTIASPPTSATVPSADHAPRCKITMNTSLSLPPLSCVCLSVPPPSVCSDTPAHTTHFNLGLAVHATDTPLRTSNRVSYLDTNTNGVPPVRSWLPCATQIEGRHTRDAATPILPTQEDRDRERSRRWKRRKNRARPVGREKEASQPRGHSTVCRIGNAVHGGPSPAPAPPRPANQSVGLQLSFAIFRQATARPPPIATRVLCVHADRLNGPPSPPSSTAGYRSPRPSTLHGS